MSRHHPDPYNHYKCDVCHFIVKRRLTISEIKRIMSLLDDFIVTGSMSQKIERCGRMVPSLMMKASLNLFMRNVIVYHIMNGVKIMSKNYDFTFIQREEGF